jgi:hypothetical protein
MEPWLCPNCKLFNLETTTVCECGWSSLEQKLTMRPGAAVYDTGPPVSEIRSRANGQLVFGVVLLLAGLLITAVTYGDASAKGGTYIIAYGPIIVGIIKIFRGLAAMSS